MAKEFEQNAELSSLAFGMANNRFVVVPDSPEGIAPEKIREEIDAVVDGIVECLTTPPPVAVGGNGAGAATAVSRASVEQYEGSDQFEALERFNQAFVEKSRGDGFSHRFQQIEM